MNNCKDCKYKDRYWCSNIFSKLYRNDGKKHIKDTDTCGKFEMKQKELLNVSK